MTDTITLAHGAGGMLSKTLMDEVIMPAFDNPVLRELHDGAKLTVSGHIAFTTDSYVVKPLFFPGGNIGKLAVCGTVNDLAMTGAVPKFISVGVIIEEGFPTADLTKIVTTMRQTADKAGVVIATGDTKVVGKGQADGIFINTAGIGEIIPGADIAPANVRPGMKVLLSGALGDHSAVIMAGRHNLELPENIVSDCAPLNGMVRQLLAAAPHTAVLRDPTRGGLAAVLNEIALAAEVGIVIEENALPIHPPVQGLCDILGLDPLYLANEGKAVAFVPEEEAKDALTALKNHANGQEAAIIGEVTDKNAGRVALKTDIGGLRVVDMPLGSLVPRIC